MADEPPDNGNPMPSRKPHAVCGARCRDGRACTQRPMANGRCKMHGGKTPGGIASPHFRHGRYSKYVPRNLRGAYETARADEELVSLRDELALLTVRITQLLQELSANPTSPGGDVLTALDRLKAAGGGDDAGPALAALEQVVRNGRDAGRAQEAIWREIREVVQEKTRTARAQWTRLGDLQGVVTVEQALAFAKALLAARNGPWSSCRLRRSGSDGRDRAVAWPRGSRPDGAPAAAGEVTVATAFFSASENPR
jgi:hypothetical protein